MLLGELLDKWIGGIDVAPTRGSPGLLRVARLISGSCGCDSGRNIAGACRVRRRRLLQAIVPQPHHVWAEGAEWSLIKLSPPEAPDFADQDDLFVARTPNLAVWKATRRPMFFDERFTRSGETFCVARRLGGAG